MLKLILFGLLDLIVKTLELLTTMLRKMISNICFTMNLTSRMAIWPRLIVFKLRSETFFYIFDAATEHKICYFGAKAFDVDLLFTDDRTRPTHPDPSNRCLSLHLMLEH